jgi:RNA polymerase sigma-70 factor (ECF subfamily)
MSHGSSGFFLQPVNGTSLPALTDPVKEKGSSFSAAVRHHRTGLMTKSLPALSSEPLSREDIEPLYRAHWSELHRVARRLVGPVEADSVVQEVFIDLLRNAELRARFVGGSVRAWLTEIARRKSLELLRKRGREIPSEDAGDGVGAADPDWGARELVEKFLAREVPEAQRRFFVVRFLERRTQVEAAQLLGVARSTLEGWEHKLTRALRRFIMEGG